MSRVESQMPVILVADDDPDILELVEMVLDDEGYEVLTARDGEKALALAKEQRPDLCLLDGMMPKLDGCEVTAKLRAAEATAAIPVIILSARTQREAVARGREAGADEYVTKPFIPDDLLRSIHGLIATPEASDDPGPSVLSLVEGGKPERAPPGGLILVAAADVNLVRLVAYRLELGGFEVATAHDPAEAVQIAGERRPDLCIVDGAMPADLGGCPVKRLKGSFGVQELYEEIEGMLPGAGAGRRTA